MPSALSFFVRGVIATALVCSGKLLKTKQEPPACANIECAPLKCPTGFDEKQEPGTCCPVCFNPDIKLEAVSRLLIACWMIEETYMDTLFTVKIPPCRYLRNLKI
eukprot:g1803.t1